MSHDCVLSRCDDDPRPIKAVEVEGYAAGLAGVPYELCPYGHAHPDMRFNAWVSGWRRAHDAAI